MNKPSLNLAGLRQRWKPGKGGQFGDEWLQIVGTTNTIYIYIHIYIHIYIAYIHIYLYIDIHVLLDPLSFLAAGLQKKTTQP